MSRLVLAGLAVLVSLLVVCPTVSADDKHTTDSIDTVEKNLTNKRAVLVDVREENETNQGYIGGAILLPLSLLKEGAETDGFGKVLAQRLPKKAIIYTYCRSGGRSLLASAELKKLGYDARALKHGFDALVKEGFVPAKPKKKK